MDLKLEILIIDQFKTVNCPYPNGVFADPDDSTCMTYYVCGHGIAYEYKCSPGTVFDPQINSCNWLCLVQKMLMGPVGVLSTLPDPPNCHLMENMCFSFRNLAL